MIFQLWGSKASTVEITIGGMRSHMTASADGGWTVEVDSTGPGTDYAFIINGGQPLPDAVHAVVDTSAVPFLEQLAAEGHALEAHLGRHLVLIAESDLNDPRVVRPPELGGYGLEAQWSDDFHHALHTVLTGECAGYYADFGSLADLARALTSAFVDDGRYSRFRDRRHGRPTTGLSGHCFLGYLQNHDQAGNRAIGERSSHLMTPGRLKIEAALVLTSPFVPLVFQGEEWGASALIQQGRPVHVLLASEAGTTVGATGVTLPPDAVVILGAGKHACIGGVRT